MCNYDGNTFDNKVVKLTNDINLSGLWEPIGKWIDGTGESVPMFENDAVFMGKFDGQGHSINNLRISSSTDSYQALFGHVKKGFAADSGIYNLTVNGVVSCKEQGAGVVAYMEGGTIDNVTSNVNVSAERMAGGIVARVRVKDGSSATTFNTCVNNGTITGRSSSGNSGVGGITGEVDSNAAVTFQACINNGISDDTNGTHVGGILGHVQPSNTGDLTFDNCINTATVYGGRNGVMAKIGGIVGCVQSDSNLTLSTCSNKGSISSSAIVGGILGYSESKGLVAVNDCKNTGTIHSTDNGYYAGGVIGTIQTGTVNNGCEGGYAAITGTYTGRLIGRAMVVSGYNLTLDIGNGRVGNENERTIGCLHSSSAPNVIINSGILYGKPYSNSNSGSRMVFKAGTKWVQDSGTTLPSGGGTFAADTTFRATKYTYNWVEE